MRNFGAGVGDCRASGFCFREGIHMRSVAMACVGLMLLASMASAGERAVSKSTLHNMGLGGMKQLSDDAGLAVRGKGTSAHVWGGSTANWTIGGGGGGGGSPWGWNTTPAGPTQTATNNYEAAASWIG